MCQNETIVFNHYRNFDRMARKSLTSQERPSVQLFASEFLPYSMSCFPTPNKVASDLQYCISIMQKLNFGPLLLIIFCLTLGFGSHSYAQTHAEKTKPSPFSILTTASHSRSLYDYQDGTRSESNDFEFMPSYKWKDNVTALYWTYSQDMRFPEKADIGDFALINAFKAIDFSRVKLAPSITLIMPQSKESRSVRNLEGALAAKLGVSIQQKLLIPGFSFGVSVSAARNFHRYDTAIDGSLNNQYSSRQVVMTSYTRGIFTVGGEFHHLNAWTYAGNLKESFEHAEEASVALGKHFEFTLGHTNSGSVFKENAKDSNVKLIDDNNSLVYAKVSMQY